MAFCFATDLISSPGGRASNEDFCNFLTLPGAACWVLCDGHGGGDTAARLAAETMLRCFAARPELAPGVLADAVAAAHAAIVERQSADASAVRMATTAVVLASDMRSALWAHIGDSRLYQFRDGRVVAQTEDHSGAQALADAGEIRPASIRFHPGRGSLRRSLGKAEPDQPTLSERVALTASDAFLLASDGFWEYVTEVEMEIELSKARAPGEWLRGMENRLRHAASGEFDNYSALGVFVESSPA